MEVSFRNSNAAKPQFHLENNLLLVGESSFNMRQWGDKDINGGGGVRKFLDTRKGGSEKIVGLGGGL